jgi:Transposase and inactivated derivatives
MEVLHPHCAGMDVHQESVVVCVLTTGQDGNIVSETRTFGTMTKQLFELLSWLESESVTHIAMESTGVYWKPIYNVLEGYFDITVANAHRIKNVPGRKTDVSDAEWIAKLHRVGLIEPSFIPPEDIRELRELCRLRKKRLGHLTAEKNRIQKYLECSNIKLGTVATDVFGISGRNLLARLIAKGYVDEQDITDSLKGRLRSKKELVSESMVGSLTPHQIDLIRDCWEHIEYLEKSLENLEQKIDAHLVPHREEYELLQTIPGVSEATAASLIAELGVNMNQFPSADHLSSWAGVAPGNHESAGKKKSTKSLKGNSHTKVALCEAAWAVARTRNNRLSAKFWKTASRRGKKKACIAIGRTILVIAYMMLKNKQAYIENGSSPVNPAS